MTEDHKAPAAAQHISAASEERFIASTEEFASESSKATVFAANVIQALLVACVVFWVLDVPRPLHNLEVLDKNAGKLKTFYATIDYSQFQGALRIPTLASGGGISDIPRFGGNFRFKFQEGKYVIASKID